MKITLNKEFYYQFFFSFCVIIPFFNNYELSFLSWLVALGLTFKKSYSVSFVRYVSYFIFIFLLALVVGFFYQHRLYFVIRDITYLLKPILGLFIGYQFFSNQIKNPFKFLLFAGLAMAIIHLGLVGYGLFIKGASSVSKIREYGGYFNDYEVYALIILIFYKKLQIELTSKQKGNLTELQCLTAFMAQGCGVNIPYGDNSKYDFIADINGNLYKIQVMINNLKESKQVNPKIKWSAKKTHIGFILGTLAQNGYIEAPKHKNGEINFTAYAKLIKQNFEVDVNEET